MSQQSSLHFDQFEIDRGAWELRLNGTRLPLGPQPVRLLAILVERAGTLVTREDLYRALWPERDIDMNRALNTCMRQIRLVLRPHAGRNAYILTYPRRGYRFVMPDRASTVARRHGSRWRAVAVAAGTIIVGVALGSVWWNRTGPHGGHAISLAVLPFDVRGDTTIQQVLARGLTESILTTLAAIDPTRLRVLGWTVPQRTTGAGVAPPRFNADFAITGSLTADSDAVNVQARLVRSDDGSVVWADSYQRPLLDAMTLEREISTRIVAALLPHVPIQSLQARPLPPAPARLELLKAAYLLTSQDVTRRADAAPHFLLVLAIDSSFAPAAAGLAEAYFWANRPSDARAAVTRALALDPNEAHGLFVRSSLRLMMDWDWTGAEDDARRAIARQPGRPEYHQGLAYILSTAGRHAEAIRELRLAQALDPVSPNITGDLGYVYFLAGQFEQALTLCRQTVELDPGAALGNDCAFAASTQLHRWRDAALHAARLTQLYGRSPADIMGSGDDEVRVRRFQQWKANALARASTKGQVSSFWLAVVQADAGQLDRAVESLERAARERSMGYVAVRVDARLSVLRSNPRFARLVRELDAVEHHSPDRPRGS